MTEIAEHKNIRLLGLLPTEDAKAFERLRKQLIADFRPIGALERDKVETIAKLVWRRRNLSIFEKNQPSVLAPANEPDPLQPAVDCYREARIKLQAEWTSNRRRASQTCSEPSGGQQPQLMDRAETPPANAVAVTPPAMERTSEDDSVIATVPRLMDEFKLTAMFDRQIDGCVRSLLSLQANRAQRLASQDRYP